MFAIKVKYLGPTNSQGSRLLASGGNVARTKLQVNGEDLELVQKAVVAAHLSKFHFLSDYEKNPNNWVSGWVDNDVVFVLVPNE